MNEDQARDSDNACIECSFAPVPFHRITCGQRADNLANWVTHSKSCLPCGGDDVPVPESIAEIFLESRYCVQVAEKLRIECCSNVRNSLDIGDLVVPSIITPRLK